MYDNGCCLGVCGSCVKVYVFEQEETKERSHFYKDQVFVFIEGKELSVLHNFVT